MSTDMTDIDTSGIGTTRSARLQMRLADLLDRANAHLDEPMSADVRGLIFRAVESPTGINWMRARRYAITEDHSLWQALVDTGMDVNRTPYGPEIVDAIEAHLDRLDTAGD
ncbi:hypothetical protein V6N00_12480 [Tersicoccus sp. MR15.9]|uniref:hypothetical protein n=1 Tax=Tersicoccus mangrovi TaxID=3121635 RepID=UPI002FE5B8DB